MHHTQNQLDKNQKSKFQQKPTILDVKIQKQITPIIKINGGISSQKTGRNVHGKEFERS